MIDGVKVLLAGTEYVVPPLNLRAVRRLGPKLIKLSAVGQRLPTEEEFDVIAEVAHAALARNYPGMKLEDLDELLDMRNIHELLAAVMGVSGFERKEGGGPEAPGSQS